MLKNSNIWAGAVMRKPPENKKQSVSGESKKQSVSGESKYRLKRNNRRERQIRAGEQNRDDTTISFQDARKRAGTAPRSVTPVVLILQPVSL